MYILYKAILKVEKECRLIQGFISLVYESVHIYCATVSTYSELGLFKVMKRQRFEVMCSGVVLNYWQLVRKHTHTKRSTIFQLKSVETLHRLEYNYDTFASLKLRRSASLLAPTSCTLAIDITLPKREKDATCSSFSLRDLESIGGIKREVSPQRYLFNFVMYLYYQVSLDIPEDLSVFDVLWNNNIIQVTFITWSLFVFRFIFQRLKVAVTSTSWIIL